MPRLLSLLLCEKVIIDRNTGTPSVIGIFQKMTVPILPDVPIPENAISPIKWAVFVMWQHDDNERNEEFVQRTQILMPDGKIFAETSAVFKVVDPDDLQSKNTVEVFGLPISNEGTAIVRVWIEGVEGAAGEYPFFIRHQRQAPNETGQIQQPAN